MLENASDDEVKEEIMKRMSFTNLTSYTFNINLKMSTDTLECVYMHTLM